jgi:hypothetical protein
VLLCPNNNNNIAPLYLNNNSNIVLLRPNNNNNIAPLHLNNNSNIALLHLLNAIVANNLPKHHLLVSANVNHLPLLLALNHRLQIAHLSLIFKGILQIIAALLLPNLANQNITRIKEAIVALLLPNLVNQNATRIKEAIVALLLPNLVNQNATRIKEEIVALLLPNPGNLNATRIKEAILNAKMMILKELIVQIAIIRPQSAMNHRVRVMGKQTAKTQNITVPTARVSKALKATARMPKTLKTTARVHTLERVVAVAQRLTIKAPAKMELRVARTIIPQRTLMVLRNLRVLMDPEGPKDH